MSTAFSTLYQQLGRRLNDSPTADGVWTLERKKQFVNDAIAHAYTLGWYREILDETTTVTANAVEYTLPAAIATMRQVIEITLEQGTNEPYAGIRGYDPRLVESASGLPTASGARVKLLLGTAFPTAGKIIRIRYKAAFPSLSADADVTEVPAELIYLFGKYLAHAEKCSLQSEADRKLHIEERNAALAELRALGFGAPMRSTLESIPSRW